MLKREVQRCVINLFNDYAKIKSEVNIKSTQRGGRPSNLGTQNINS